MRFQNAFLGGAAALTSLLVEARSLNFDFPYDAASPVPYTISVDKNFIEETRQKAKLYRPSIELKDDSNAEWLEGPPSDALVKLSNDWANDYDWSKVEQEINSEFSHFAVTVDGSSNYSHPVPLHFVHERSADPNAIPLLLLHGWPSSYLEWSKVIKPLASRAGGNATFHVVAPDLPGYGFSPAPEYAGLSPSEMGLAFDKLMKKLGYNKYGVASTDLGWLVGAWMTNVVPDSLIGHFTDFILLSPNATDLERYQNHQTTEEETAYISSLQLWQSTHSAYMTIHSQNPLVISQALTDSPVGFAGWRWHLVRASSAGYEYSSKELITDTLMLLIQGTFGNIRSYRESVKPEVLSFPMSTVPSAATVWGGFDIKGYESTTYVPREWVARIVNLVYFSKHTDGGHFPANNVPDAWVKEVRTFFSGLAAGAF